MVDDEPGLHDVTRLVLKRLEFAGRPVRLLSAFSAEEARGIIERTPGIAVAVIDVVMENDRAGLDLIHDIRSRFGRDLTRIILPTGNPGMAPEREVIRHFEIDDYRDKTELTADRLYAEVCTALRAYQSLQRFKETTEHLERIVGAMHTLNRYSDLADFLNLVLDQLVGIARGTDSVALFKCALSTPEHPDGPSVVFGTGEFEVCVHRPLTEVAPEALAADVHRALHEPVFELRDEGVLLSVVAPKQERVAIWLATRRPLEPHVARLLDPEHASLIEAAAPLHDIGKVSVPDAVLDKPGRLDEQEMAVMRAHAANGHELLAASSSAMLRLGAVMALTHHERWDGGGYPNRLAGEAIPIEGRIVALADVFDALMSARIYKPPYSFDETCSIIRESAGTHFDPRLVEVFDTNRYRFLEIFDANPDLDTPPD